METTDDSANIKQKYEKCFITWYKTTFIKGEGKEKVLGCPNERDEYVKCMEQHVLNQKQIIRVLCGDT
jgi:hypothetical protein